MKKPIVIVVGAQLMSGKFHPDLLCWEVAEPVRRIRQSGLVAGLLLVVLGEVPADVSGEDIRGVCTRHHPRFFPRLVQLEEYHDAKEGGEIQRLTPHLTSETTEYLTGVFGRRSEVPLGKLSARPEPAPPPVDVLTVNVPSYRSDERMFSDILDDTQYLPFAECALVYSPNGGLMIPTVEELVRDIENPAAGHRVVLRGAMRKVA